MSENRHEPLPELFQLHVSKSLPKEPEAAIFSQTHTLVFPEMLAAEKLQQALVVWMEEIRDWAKDHRYLVGHIKVFADGQENLWLSSTGKSIRLKPSSGWNNWLIARINLSVTAIIFGVAKDVLTERAGAGLQACFKRLEARAERPDLRVGNPEGGKSPTDYGSGE